MRRSRKTESNHTNNSKITIFVSSHYFWCEPSISSLFPFIQSSYVELYDTLSIADHDISNSHSLVMQSLRDLSAHFMPQCCLDKSILRHIKHRFHIKRTYSVNIQYTRSSRCLFLYHFTIFLGVENRVKLYIVLKF